MLVIISDLHFCDDTLGRTLSPGAFELFRELLGDLAVASSWREATRRSNASVYRPVSTIDLVLLGDILDLVRSSTWLNGPVRPWSAPSDPLFRERVSQVTEAVIANNAPSLETLRKIGTNFTIPAAQGGKPSRKRQRVNVRIHYIVGNHDWFLHLPGKEFNPVRRRLKEVMGLHNNPAQPFPHNPGDIPVLSNALRAHEVVARHGDEYDSLNFHGNRATASVGDAIVIELVCRFYQQVTDRFGAQLSSSCIQALREIDNVRPLSSIPGWIHGLLLRTCEDSALRDQIAETWNELAREFLNLPFVKSHDTPFTLERIDWLQGLLKLGGIIGLGRAARVAQHPVMEWLIPRESYSQFALAEPAIVDGSARFVVYGHTHHHEVIPISRTKDEREQFYINSGTWRRIHELGQLDRADLRFLDYSVMTTVAFFRDGERKGRRFEVWNGALDNIKKDYE